MVYKTVCTLCETAVNILCCTRKHKIAEDVDIKIGNIQSKTEGITEDIIKIIIEPEKNASIRKSCISQAYVSQKPNSESSKKSSQNTVSTNNSKILGSYYIRFAKCKCCQQEHQNSSEDEIKLQVMIVTDKHNCGNLFELDEPHRHNVPEIDIQNPEVTAKLQSTSQSRRLPQPQLLVTSSTRNSQCNCRADNSTTSTSYLPIKKQKPHREKQDKINSYPLTSTEIDEIKKTHKQSFRKYIAGIFRHSVSKSSKK